MRKWHKIYHADHFTGKQNMVREKNALQNNNNDIEKAIISYEQWNAWFLVNLVFCFVC